MQIRPERAAIEQLIPQLRPFSFDGDDRFVLADGTKLFVAGISYGGPPNAPSDGVLVLTTAQVDTPPTLSKTASCVGAVILRPTTTDECREQLCTTRTVEGVAFETTDKVGNRVFYRINRAATFPVLV
jgi:hypothetical protein